MPPVAAVPIDPRLPQEDETEDRESGRGEEEEEEEEDGEDPSDGEGGPATVQDENVSAWSRKYTRMGGPFTPIGEVVDVGVTWESACATWLANHGGEDREDEDGEDEEAGGGGQVDPDPRGIPASLYDER